MTSELDAKRAIWLAETRRDIDGCAWRIDWMERKPHLVLPEMIAHWWAEWEFYVALEEFILANGDVKDQAFLAMNQAGMARDRAVKVEWAAQQADFKRRKQGGSCEKEAGQG